MLISHLNIIRGKDLTVGKIAIKMKMTSQCSHLPDIGVNNMRCPLANCEFSVVTSSTFLLPHSQGHTSFTFTESCLLSLWEEKKTHTHTQNTFRCTVWHTLPRGSILCKRVYKHTSEARCGDTCYLICM